MVCGLIDKGRDWRKPPDPLRPWGNIICNVTLSRSSYSDDMMAFTSLWLFLLLSHIRRKTSSMVPQPRQESSDDFSESGHFTYLDPVTCISQKPFFDLPPYQRWMSALIYPRFSCAHYNNSSLVHFSVPTQSIGHRPLGALADICQSFVLLLSLMFVLPSLPLVIGQITFPSFSKPTFRWNFSMLSFPPNTSWEGLFNPSLSNGLNISSI